MDVHLLGGLQVEVGGRSVALGGPQARSVLALLAIDAGTTVARSTIVDELWPGGPPRTAVNTVQTHVATIRRALGPERGRLRTRGAGYVLEVSPDELDTARFELLARRGRERLEGGDPDAARGHLETALAAWSGEPLLGLTARAPRLAIERTRLTELHLAAAEDLTEAQLRLGTAPTVLERLERAVTTDPFRERTVALLLRSMAAGGRRAEALAGFESFRRRMVDELGLDPSDELRGVHLQLLGASSAATPALVGPAATSARPRPGALPTFHTRRFGREHDLDAVAELLRTERLVTLVGPGGCGKTRTAIELATRVGRARGWATRFVDLAPVRAGELVERTTALALGVTLDPHTRSVHEQIVRHVDGPLLVVLDNCEHLVDAVATHVRRVLADCPAVTVLATSREPLEVDGERVWRLGGLDLPEDGQAGAAAVQLLLDRGRSVRHDLTFGAADVDAAVDICRRLDGLPLAIELVAGHLAHQTPGELAERLRDHERSRLLHGSRRGPRHRTLETTIDWSYQLLDPRGRQLLRALSVFVGGADLVAVTAVAGREGGDVEVLQQLGSLVARSLVTATEIEGRTRYGLLETIREFAGRRLHDDGEEATVRSAHRDHLLTRLETLPWDHRMFSERVTKQLEPELGNLRVAIESSVATGDLPIAARLAFGAPTLVIIGSHWDEYDRWLTRLWGTSAEGLTLAGVLDRVVEPAHLAAASWMEGWRFAGTVDEVAAAVPILQRGAEGLPPSEPAHTFLEHMVAIGELWHVTSDATAGLERMLELAEDARRQGAHLLWAAVLDNAGLFQLLAGRYDDAVRTLEPCAVPTVWEHYPKPLLTLAFAQHLAGAHDAAARTMRANAEVVERPEARFLTLLALALTEAGVGDLEGARELIRRARAGFDQPRWRHPQLLADGLVVLGACAAIEGRHDRAVRLLTAAGSPTGTFRPITAIHLHYLTATGAGDVLDGQAVGDEGVDIGSPPDEDLGSLFDEELLRWARGTPSLPTSGRDGVPWTSPSG